MVKRLLGLGALAGVGYAVWRAMESRRNESSVTWDAQPFPYPPQPRQPLAPVTPERTSSAGWVEPDDGVCPRTHPVKAKLTSGIFHVEGGASYERTNADRCYASPEAAEADGLRASKV
ncbi:MAG: hypothetical protein ABW033_01475 [Acidimicrobiia bacterium]